MDERMKVDEVGWARIQCIVFTHLRDCRLIDLIL